MTRILLATVAGAVLAAAATTGAMAQETANVGIILGFSGPLELITPGMAASGELALKEASDSASFPAAWS